MKRLLFITVALSLLGSAAVSQGTVGRFRYLYADTGRSNTPSLPFFWDDSLRVNGYIWPEATNTFDIGSSALRWRSGYFRSIHGDTAYLAVLSNPLGALVVADSLSIAGAITAVTSITGSGDAIIGGNYRDTLRLWSRTIALRDSGFLVMSPRDSMLVNGAEKGVRLAIPSYDTSLRPFVFAHPHSLSGRNVAAFGGGTSFGMAAQLLDFYVGKYGTTLGIKVFRFDSVGNATFGGQIANSQVNAGLRIQLDTLADNNSQRIFWAEDNNGLFGFSAIYAGNTNPTFGGTAFTLATNTFYFRRHDNSATGSNVFSVARSSSDVTFNGALSGITNITASGTGVFGGTSIASTLLSLRGTAGAQYLIRGQTSQGSQMYDFDTLGTFRTTVRNTNAPGIAARNNAETGYGIIQIENASSGRKLELFYVGTSASTAYGVTAGNVGINAQNGSLGISTADALRATFNNTGLVMNSLAISGATTVAGSGAFSPGGVTTEGALGVSAVNDTVRWTGQGGTISAQNFANTTTGKKYLLTIYANTTTTGTGTATVTVGWNDGAGAKTYTTASFDLSSTANAGMVQDVVTIYVGSGTPTWSTSATVTGGTPAYAVNVALLREW